MYSGINKYQKLQTFSSLSAQFETSYEMKHFKKLKQQQHLKVINKFKRPTTSANLRKTYVQFVNTTLKINFCYKIKKFVYIFVPFKNLIN